MNTDTVIVRDSKLQREIWSLPIFTSLKSCEDIFHRCTGSLLYSASSDQSTITLQDLKLFSGEYELTINGSIFSKEGAPDKMELDIRLLYSETFKKYIAVLHAFIRSRSKMLPPDAEHTAKGWESVNEIRFRIPFKQ